MTGRLLLGRLPVTHPPSSVRPLLIKVLLWMLYGGLIMRDSALPSLHFPRCTILRLRHNSQGQLKDCFVRPLFKVVLHIFCIDSALCDTQSEGQWAQEKASVQSTIVGSFHNACLVLYGAVKVKGCMPVM